MGKNTMQMDIYSMGVMFYELATLRHPFASNPSDQEEWKNAHLHEAPTVPSRFNAALPLSMDQVLLKMLAKKTSDRYKDWDQISDALHKGEPGVTVEDPNVESVLRIIVRKTDERTRTELEAAKKQTRKDEYSELVASQFKNDIVAPIRGFVERLNEKSEMGRADVYDSKKGNELSCRISLSQGASVGITMQILHDDEHTIKRHLQHPLHDGTKVVYEHSRPVFRNQKIMAWGILLTSSGHGANLLLVKSGDEIYGNWLHVENFNNPGYKVEQRQSQPFPFQFGEIEEELGYVGVLHVYRSNIEAWSANKVAEFISRAIESS